MAVLLVAASFLFAEIYDLDIGWHLAIGRAVLARHAVPRVDEWTVLGAGRPYHDSHWLFQAAAALAERLGGMLGVQLLMVALWSMTLAACYRLARRRLPWAGAALLALTVLLASLERILPRPELVSYAAFAAFLLWTSSPNPWRPANVARLALVQLLWVNSHGLFVLGPFVVGCAALADLWRRRAEGLRAARAPAAGLAAVLAATLVNPWGLGTWRYAALLFAEARGEANPLVAALGELSSPFGAAARSSPAIWVYYALLGAFAAAGLTALRRRHAVALAPWAIALGALALSTTGRRNVVLFAIGVVPVLAAGAAGLKWPARSTGASARALVAASLLALSAYPLSGRWYLDLELPARTGFGATPSFFPYGWAEFARRIGFRGPVLASNTLGGFVTFAAVPETLPLTDGRWEVQDPRTLARVLAASRTPGVWRSLVGEFGVRALLLAHTSPEGRALVPELARDPAWRLVYLDAAASFWLPTGGPAQSRPVALGDAAALARVRRSEDGLFLATFYRSAQAPAAEAAALERTLAHGDARPAVLERLGRAWLEARQFDRAESAFALLLAVSPRSPVALNELAFLAFRRGDLERAAALTRQLLTVAPTNAEFRANQERIEAARRARAAAGPAGKP